MKHFSESYGPKLQIPLSVHALNADPDSVRACMRRVKLAMASRHYTQKFSAICRTVAFPEDHGQVRENEHLVGEFEVVLEELRQRAANRLLRMHLQRQRKFQGKWQPKLESCSRQLSDSSRQDPSLIRRHNGGLLYEQRTFTQTL